ncbi:hypothetical protein [Streptomyces sp. NPDC051569]|uniref:hypothetical protein n=1 Tax=Streptomyces sp. NPDC051569 TaxID=3365661 RepID=UPI0037993F3B
MDQKRDSGTEQEESGAKGRGKGPGQRLELSVPQVAGSALAAVTAAVLASQLGVYGTIIGAGVVSVVATAGGSVFQHLFRRTGEQLREVTVQSRPAGSPASSHQVPAHRPTALRPTAVREGPADGPPEGEFGEATTHGTRMRGWKRPVLAAGVVFGVTMIGITGFELISGQDLSGGKGTTVGSVVRGGDRSASPGGPAGTPDPGGEQGGTPESGTPAGGGGAGVTDPSSSPDAGPGAGPGGAGPSHVPSPAPSHSEGGQAPSAPGPAPSPSTGTGDPGTGSADGGVSGVGGAEAGAAGQGTGPVAPGR